MKYDQMTRNYTFRVFKCSLSVEETAKLCFKSVRTVTRWDSGKVDIPPECRRLMKLYSGFEFSDDDEWYGFSFVKGRLLLPTGVMAQPQQILTGMALVEICCSDDRRTMTRLLKYARAIARIRNTVTSKYS
ncbi:MAG: phage protein [Aliivibrio sp.]|uniref:regulator n=1 Tax=Aliivibrio sp. TaxID=1872443 RepID=UPI001A516BEC|nr:phage protein [Aliivibrio sp.]